MFADNIAALESFFPVLTFKSVPLFVELSGEEGEGDLPSFGCVFLPIIQKPGLEEAAHVHLLDEVEDFNFVLDGDSMVATFDMAAVKLVGKGVDV